MANLKSDSEGFLVGDPIDVKSSLSLLTDIRDEIRLLRTALTGGIKLKNSSITVSAPSSARRAPTTPRDPSGRFVKSAAPSQSSERFVSTPTLKNIGKSAFRKSTYPDDLNATARFTGNTASDRDANGRFTGQSDDSSGFSQSGGLRSLLNGLPQRIGLAVGQTNEELQQADPTIQAANEVFGPLAAGYRTLFSSEFGNSEDVPWYRRIFRELRLTRKENSAYSKAETKALKDIEKKPVFGGDGGSMLPAILAGLIPIALGAFGLFTDKGQEILTGIGNTFSQGWTATTTYFRDKWDKGIEYFGSLWDGASKKWDDSVKAFDNLWTPISTYLKEKFGIVTDAVNNTVDAVTTTVVETANKANVAVKNATGIDVKESAKSGYAKAVDFVSRNVIEPTANAIEAGKQAYSDYTNADMRLPGKSTKERWMDAKGYLKNASDKAGVDPGVLAKIANYESKFNPNAMPITRSGKKLSSAHGYGQFLDGTWTQYINKYGAKYGVEGAGKLSESQAAKYRTNKAVQAGMLAEFTRENVEKGRSLGGKDDDANVYALHNLGSGDGAKFLKALRNNPNAPVSSVLSGRVISGNPSLYGNGGISVAQAYAKQGQAMRQGEFFANDIRQESSIASMKPAATATTTQTSPFINPSAPTLSQPPSIADAEPVINPLSSRGKQDFISLDVKGMVNQDVSDPRIAHLVSGGYSRS